METISSILKLIVGLAMALWVLSDVRGSTKLAITLIALVLAVFSTGVSTGEAIVVTVLALLIFVSRNV